MTHEQFQTVRQRLNQTPKDFASTIGKSLRMTQYYETGEHKIPKHVEILVLRLAAEKDFQESVNNVDAMVALS